MFELNMHRRSVSGSSSEVQHSSPMTVPGSARQRTPYALFLSSNDLPAGTIPDTPGPMQRAFNRDPANHIPWQNASSTPLERYAPSTPVLTPLPSTNLSVEDVDPELVLLPPSINPSVVQVGQGNPGYFDISVGEQPQMDSTDILNGLACLKLAEDHSDPDETEPSALNKKNLQVCVGHCGNLKEMRCGYEDTNLQDAFCATHRPPGHTQTFRRKQQVQHLNNSVHTLNVPQHCQVLPLRPKQPDEDLQDRVWKDSVISSDCHTTSGERSTITASEHNNDRRAQIDFTLRKTPPASHLLHPKKGVREPKMEAVLLATSTMSFGIARMSLVVTIVIIPGAITPACTTVPGMEMMTLDRQHPTNPMRVPRKSQCSPILARSRYCRPFQSTETAPESRPSQNH
jgi:hypothetical protein